MSVEPPVGTETPANVPPVSLSSSREDDPSSSRPPRAAVPVAKPPTATKPGRPAVKPQLNPPPEEEIEEEVLPPSALKGWATSVVLHAVFLLIMALWFFSPSRNPPKVIDTTLAGSEFGDDLGDQFKGGLGMDTPLNMPQADLAPLEAVPTITSLPANSLDIRPDIPKANDASAASNAGGANLTNPGVAGSGDGFGVARFGHGGERVNGVDIKVGNPQFTLIWDSKADLDIHVKEPGGSEIYWEQRNGTDGGELDVDDVDGYGPENVYWGGGIDKGNGPPGEYKWFVHYYAGFDGRAGATRWKVRLKHDGKVTVFEGKLRGVNDRSKIYTFTIDGDRPATDEDEKKER